MTHVGEHSSVQLEREREKTRKLYFTRNLKQGSLTGYKTRSKHTKGKRSDNLKRAIFLDKLIFQATKQQLSI